MARIRTIKDIFSDLTKRVSRRYIERQTLEKIFCIGNRAAIQKAYIAGARYGWNKRGEMDSWKGKRS